MIEIEVTLPDSHLLRLAQNLPDATKNALLSLAIETSIVLRREIDRIYDRPIPVSRTGRALWVRTGDLRRSPTLPQWIGNGAVINWTGRPARAIRNWPGGYAHRRNDLGVTWFPRKPAGGIIRKNNFIGDTRRIIEPQADRIFTAELLKRLQF